MGEALIPGGYILLSRKIIESEIFKKPPLYIKVWVYLLSIAQHSDYKQLKRGQCRTSIPEIQEACSWYVGYRKEVPTKDQIFQIIEWLRKPHESNCESNGNPIMIATTKATQGILVNIENYSFYQNSKNYESNDESDDETDTEAMREQRQPDNINKNDKNEKNKNIYSSDSNEYKLADYLYNYMLKNNPKCKQPVLQTWAKQFDAILRIDKRDLEDVKAVIKFCQTDEFWKLNILSPNKLREKYDQLYLKMNQAAGNKPKQTNNGVKPSNPEKLIRRDDY